MGTVAEDLVLAVEKAVNGSQILHDVANGPSTDIVQTLSGPVPTVNKWFADKDASVTTYLDDKFDAVIGPVTEQAESARQANYSAIDAAQAASGSANRAQEEADRAQEAVDGVGNNLTVTATGTSAHPDTAALAHLARRVAYMLPAKVAVAPALSVGTNVIPLSAFVGDAVDPTHFTGFSVVGYRGGAAVSLVWQYLPATDEIQIDGAIAGDVPIALQYSIGGGDVSNVMVGSGGAVKTLAEWLTLAEDLGNKDELSSGAFLVGRATAQVFSWDELGTVKGRYDGDRIHLVSHHAGVNAGDGPYRWNASSTAADSTGSVRAVAGVPVGRWIIETGGRVDIDRFGATPGGDCGAALGLAADWCRTSGDVLTGAGAYTMGATVVNLRQVAVDAPNLNITTASAGARIILGNVSTSGYGPKQSIGQLWKNNEQITAAPTIQIVGARCQTIEIGFTNKVQVYADAALAADTSTAYCVFNISYAYRVELRTNDSLPDGAIQWINENTFNIKRAVEISLSGTYHHNHNVFNTGTLEGPSLIFVSKGSSNLFLCERFENGPAAINFAVGTWANYVVNTWHSNSRSAYEPTSAQFTVADNGTGNMVLRNSDYAMRQNEVLSINSQTCRSFTRLTTNYTTLRGAFPSAAGQNDFEITVNFQLVLDTGLIPVRVNDGFQAIMDGTKFRCRWMIYDANGAELAAPADNTLLLRDGASTSITGNTYTQTVGVSESVAIVTGDTVGYLRCQIYGNGATGTGQRFKHVGVRSLTQHLFKDGDQRVNRMSWRQPAASAKPTVGFAEVGEVVQSTTAAATQWLCTFSESTFLSAGAAGGANTIAVSGAGVKAIGDVVGVQLDNGGTHWTTLSAVAPLTLNAALPSAAAAGKPVCFVRWV